VADDRLEQRAGDDALGMPGVFAHGNFDTWSPGYLMFIAATHNGISRLYETFGNGGSADTQERTLGPERDAAQLVQAESAAAARDVVAQKQQQLRADGLLVLAQLHRAESALRFIRTSREVEAIDPQPRSRSGGVRVDSGRTPSGAQATV
jgi:hypothetical protein